MGNSHLKSQCRIMQTNIKLFKAGAKQACLDDDGTISNAEKKYITKLFKKLDALSELLNKSP